MRLCLNAGLIFLIVFFLFIQPSYGITSNTIQIEVNGTNNLPVKGATIEVLSINVPNAPSLYFYTNENGAAIFQGEQNQTYTFRIMAENYEPVSKNITVSSDILEYKLKFTLNPIKSQKDSEFWPIFIPALLGLLMFIFWAYRFYRNRVSPHRYEKHIKYFLLLLSFFSWIPVIMYLLYKQKDYIILSDNLRFPVYIPIAALIGVLSYLLISMEEIFSQKMHIYKKRSIVYGYLRRIIIAPYIAILAVYILLDDAKIQDSWFVLVFSFFTGMFTKTIEVWLYKIVQVLLPQELRNEFNERYNYNLENSELVVRLNIEEDVVFELYFSDIDTVEQLAVANFNKLKYKNGITEEYFNYIFEKANEQLAEIKILKELLDLTPTELKLLIDKAEVYSIKDFANVDIDSIDWEKKVATENTKISNTLKQKQIKAKVFKKSEDFKLFSLEDLTKLSQICINKTEDEFVVILSLHIDLKKLKIPDWSVEDTIKIRNIPVTTLNQLKEHSSSEGNMKILQDKMKDNLRILKLFEKINQ